MAALAGSAARRYAEALLEFAAAEDAVDAYSVSLHRIGEALRPDLVRWLRDRRVPIGGRREVLDAAIAGEPRAIRAVLTLLLERDRIALVPQVAQAFGDLVDRREGVVGARVTTAVELNAAQRDELVRRLEAASGKTIRPTFSVDPALLGGTTIQLGDHLIDTSVRARLDAMRAQLAS